MTVLDEILASKRREVEALRAMPRSRASHTPLDAAATLRRGPGAALRLVAEVKLRSPSAGPLSRAMSAGDRAAAYVEAGAAMVSVLCDGPFFDGSWAHLAEARERVRVPLLAKEFVIDERQIEEARDRGADAILLVARIVERARLAALARCARAEGLEPLFEVVDERELDASLEEGARVVGVNARDLDTLAIDADRAACILAAIPRDVASVHLSGLRDARDVARIAATGADAALVGEALMREDDPRALLQAMGASAGG